MSDRQHEARHELVLLAVAVIAVSRLLDGPLSWLVAGLVLAMMLVGSLQVFGESMPEGVPVESLVVPSVAAIAGLGVVRLVPAGILLVPVLLGVGVLLDGCLTVEARILARVKGATGTDQTILVSLSLLVAFLAFTGIAALVPGGLVGQGPSGGPVPLPESSLLVLAAADAGVAFLLGYRFVALRVGRLRDAATGAVGYALAIAIGAGFLRAVALPQLLGPALLTLLFFLWDSFRGTAPAARRDPRWIWQIALLTVLGVVVVGWNLMIRGTGG